MTDDDDSLNSVDELIKLAKSSSKVLLVTHRSPDFDALGSLLGLYWIFMSIGIKQMTLFVEDWTYMPSNYKFLPGIEKIQGGKLAEILNKHDLAIFLDGNNYSRFSEEQIEIPELIKIAVIDHHMGNIGFNHDFAKIKINSSSTAEIITELFQDKDAITKESATCLLAGIYSDSKNFTIPATTSNTLKLSSYLLEQGADKDLIVEHQFIYTDKILNAIKTFINNLKFDNKKHYSYTYISRDLYDLLDMDDNDIDIIKTYLSLLLINHEDYKWGFLLRPISENLFKVSFRSRQDGQNVRIIAEKLGGGGHNLASGATIQATDVYDALSIIRNVIDSLS